MFKKIIIIVLIAVLVLAIGAGAGYFFGSKAGGKSNSLSTGITKELERPGPIVDFGDFVINLADKEPHLVNFGLSLEASSVNAQELLTDSGWRSHIRNEVLLTVKDRIADDFRSAEGIMELSDDLKRRINSILPVVDGKVPVRRILFSKFVTQ